MHHPRRVVRCQDAQTLMGKLSSGRAFRHRVMGFFHHQKFPETPWHSECTQTGISPTRMKAIVQVHKSSQIYTIGVNLVRSMYGTSDRPPKDVALHGTRPLLQVYNWLYGGFLNKSSILDWDVPWNKPSSYGDIHHFRKPPYRQQKTQPWDWSVGIEGCLEVFFCWQEGPQLLRKGWQWQRKLTQCLQYPAIKCLSLSRLNW